MTTSDSFLPPAGEEALFQGRMSLSSNPSYFPWTSLVLENLENPMQDVPRAPGRGRRKSRDRGRLLLFPPVPAG